MIRTYSILLAATLFVLSSSLGNSGTITDATGNTSFDSARNIDQGFTIGAKQDVGTTTYTGIDWVKGPNSTIVPWVSIENPKAWGQVDFFSFTVGSNSKVWVDVDYGYQTPVSSAPLQTDYDTQLKIYNSQKIDITASSSFYGNNADATFGGLGSTFYGNPDGSLDAYYAAILSPGTYYIFIGYASGNGYSDIPEAGKYTLQVSVENPAVNAVPLPSAAIFLVSGIVGLFSLKRRFKR